MDLSPEEVLANLNFKRPDLTDHSISSIKRVISQYEQCLQGKRSSSYTALLSDLAYLQLNNEFYNVLNLHYIQYIQFLSGNTFVYFCAVNIDIAKFIAERFKIDNINLLMGALRIPSSEKEFIDYLLNLVEDLDHMPPDFLYLCLRERMYYHFSVINEKVPPRSFKYSKLQDYIVAQTPPNVTRVLIIKYLDLTNNNILDCFLNLGDFSSAKFYIEVSQDLENSNYKPRIGLYSPHTAIFELKLAVSIHRFYEFSRCARIIFLYNLEIAKTCICLKTLPSVLIQLVLEFARPLASAIIPYLAKVYHPNKPMQTRSKRVKRELKGLLN